MIPCNSSGRSLFTHFPLPPRHSLGCNRQSPSSGLGMKRDEIGPRGWGEALGVSKYSHSKFRSIAVWAYLYTHRVAELVLWSTRNIILAYSAKIPRQQSRRAGIKKITSNTLPNNLIFSADHKLVELERSALTFLAIFHFMNNYSISNQIQSLDHQALALSPWKKHLWAYEIYSLLPLNFSSFTGYFLQPTSHKWHSTGE